MKLFKRMIFWKTLFLSFFIMGFIITVQPKLDWYIYLFIFMSIGMFSLSISLLFAFWTLDVNDKEEEEK